MLYWFTLGDDEKRNWPSSRLKVGRNVISIVATIHTWPKLFDYLKRYIVLIKKQFCGSISVKIQHFLQDPDLELEVVNPDLDF
jgi:hypothetical protein